MHHIKLKVPSFAPFVTGIIDNIKMTVHKYHNVWVSHRMNYEPRKLMDVKHSCGLIFDDDLGVEVGFKFSHRLHRELTPDGALIAMGGVITHTVFSPVMSFRSWLRSWVRVNDYILDSWLFNNVVKFKELFNDNKWCHTIRPVNRPSDFLMSLHTCSSFHYLSHLTITTHVTDDLTVTFKPCR